MMTSGFRLPPDITFDKQVLQNGMAYMFRHQMLGELGRLVLQEAIDGQTCIECEVVGDPADPMTAKRAAIMQPLGLELSRILGAPAGAPNIDPAKLPPRSPEPKEVIESQVIPCDRCGKVVAMLIFAPAAIDSGRFEDCARKMYTQYAALNVPTWIIGPALGSGPLMDRPADMLKVWPKRESMQRLRPAEFNPMIEKFATRHCQ
jgi:hypothetical protein